MNNGDWHTLLKRNPHGSELAVSVHNKCPECPVDVALEICELAIHNWTLALLFSRNSGNQLARWVEAKKYWEGKKNARSTETPAAPQGTG